MYSITCLKKYQIKLGILVAILSMATIHPEAVAPAALSYTAKAELATALLSGPLSGYAQYKKIAGKSDNKALALGLASDFMSIANNSLAFFNAYKKGDLYKISNDGKNAQQWLTLILILQDICSFGKTSKDLVSTLKSRNGAGDASKVEDAQEAKLTKVAKRLLVYTLPAIKTIAASARAYDSIKSAKRSKNQELINYLSFVAIAGCASLSEYLQSKQGSAAHYLAIAKAAICVAAILVDIKLHDIRRGVEHAADLAEVQRLAEAQKQQELAAAQQHELDALNAARRQAQQELAIEQEQSRLAMHQLGDALTAQEKTRQELADTQKLVKQLDEEAQELIDEEVQKIIQEEEQELIEEACTRIEKAEKMAAQATADAEEARRQMLYFKQQLEKEYKEAIPESKQGILSALDSFAKPETSREEVLEIVGKLVGYGEALNAGAIPKHQLIKN